MRGIGDSLIPGRFPIRRRPCRLWFGRHTPRYAGILGARHERVKLWVPRSVSVICEKGTSGQAPSTRRATRAMISRSWTAWRRWSAALTEAAVLADEVGEEKAQRGQDTCHRALSGGFRRGG